MVLSLLAVNTHPLLPVMLYVIGLGLSDEKDITVKGLEVCWRGSLAPVLKQD